MSSESERLERAQEGWDGPAQDQRPASMFGAAGDDPVCPEDDSSFALKRRAPADQMVDLQARMTILEGNTRGIVRIVDGRFHDFEVRLKIQQDYDEERTRGLLRRLQALEEKARGVNILADALQTPEWLAARAKQLLPTLDARLLDLFKRVQELENLFSQLDTATENRVIAAESRLAELEPAVKLLKDLHPGPEGWAIDAASPIWASGWTRERPTVPGLYRVIFGKGMEETVEVAQNTGGLVYTDTSGAVRRVEFSMDGYWRGPLEKAKAWTTALPTKPGFYWCRLNGRTFGCEIKIQSGNPYAEIPREPEPVSVTWMMPGAQWYGPIEPPE